MSFRSEAEMSERLQKLVGAASAAEGIQFLPEVNGGVGIPDFLLVKASDTTVSYVVAVELKLRNWRRGFLQAFRYKNFCNEVYLVLDRRHLAPALQRTEQFIRAGIGLASINPGGDLQIHVMSRPETPFSPYLSSRLVDRLMRRRTAQPDARPALRFTRSTSGRYSFRAFRAAFFGYDAPATANEPGVAVH